LGAQFFFENLKNDIYSGQEAKVKLANVIKQKIIDDNQQVQTIRLEVAKTIQVTQQALKLRAQ